MSAATVESASAAGRVHAPSRGGRPASRQSTVHVGRPRPSSQRPRTARRHPAPAARIQLSGGAAGARVHACGVTAPQAAGLGDRTLLAIMAAVAVVFAVAAVVLVQGFWAVSSGERAGGEPGVEAVVAAR